VRLPVVNDQNRVRWAIIPDECVGALEYPRPLREIIQRRAEIAAAIFTATHGEAHAYNYFRKHFKVQRNEMLELMNTGIGQPRVIQGAELAFMAAMDRVRILPQPTGRPPKKPKHESTDGSARNSPGGTGAIDSTTTLEAPAACTGGLCELCESGEVPAEPNSVRGVFEDPEGEDAPAH
jgi:hypothetical protein